MSCCERPALIREQGNNRSTMRRRSVSEIERRRGDGGYWGFARWDSVLSKRKPRFMGGVDVVG